MSTIEKHLVKNAPLTSSEDRSEFVTWATSVADGSISAGWQPMHPRLADDAPGHALRASGAKLVSLARRELNQTPDQIADATGIRVADVIALKHGDDVAGETVARIAGVLRLNPEVLGQLFGFREVDSRLVEAATEFILDLEPAEPLQPREMQALSKFRDAVQARRGRMQDVR